MPNHSWDLALVELIFYIPLSFPVIYCLVKHRRTGLSGWFYFLAFTTLQVVGSGMIVSAGEHGTPSTTALIITEIGLSPLILGIAGIIHEWAKTIGLLQTDERKKLGLASILLYHLLVVGGTAIYAIGASDAAKPSQENHSKGLWDAGVIVLTLLWLGLCGVFGFMARWHRRDASRALFSSILVSLPLLGVRLIYQCVATFDSGSPTLNPVTGNIALRVVLQFLPGAFILLFMVIAGIVSIGHDGGESRVDSETISEYKARGRAVRP